MTLGTTIPLPSPPAGWFDYGYAVLWNGDLALARTDRDIHTERGRWRDRVQRGEVGAAQPNFCESRLRLSTFDGCTENGAIEVRSDGWPKADRLPDGRWLIAESVVAHDGHNARLFAADGAPVGTFDIDACFSHLQCAADGTIWVGYFDQGVFSGSPISSSGIARLATDGTVLWKFNDHGDPFISDCYALTLDGPTLWCCPYTDFPIIRVEHGVMKYWRNKVAGASALAVNGDLVLLAGGYGDQAERIALLRLGDEQADQIGEWRFQRPGRQAARLLQGRGGTLHIVGDGNWTKLSVAALA